MRKFRLILAVLSSLLDEVLILGLLLWGLPKLGFAIPIPIIIIIMVLFALFAITTFKLGTRALMLKPLTGLTDMTYTEGKVTKRLDPSGFVKIDGELWRSQSVNGTIETGMDVVVVAQKNLRLTVKRKSTEIKI
jgi:membrane-bound ClpP family serine protease